MAYPANELNDPNAIAILFDEQDLDRLVKLFPPRRPGHGTAAHALTWTWTKRNRRWR